MLNFGYIWFLLKSPEASKLAVAFLLISVGFAECKCVDRHGGDKRIMWSASTGEVISSLGCTDASIARAHSIRGCTVVPLGVEMRVQATPEEVDGVFLQQHMLY
ncbi:hypothetical protein V6N11_035256 [Hibiscus sabdariffa]|uniref:Secreted protein n=1 Tax=Hibiscus sabdariffa TaxID=183260 RepID=A0ABR2QZV9_9ROSI